MLLIGIAMICSLAGTQDESKPVATFRGLGHLEGGYFQSQAFGVSADGKKVVGSSYSAFGLEGFIWTEKDGMKSLGVLEFPVHYSEAYAISSDGSVIAGYSGDKHGKVAVCWTEKDGIVSLGRCPGSNETSASAVSDGGTVVGNATMPRTVLSYTIESSYVYQGKVLPNAPSSPTEITLAGQIGFIGSAGSTVKPWTGDVPPFDFFMTQDTNPGDLLFSVKYKFEGASVPNRLYFSGPVSALGRRSLDSIDLTGISRAGTVICGTTSSLHDNDIVVHPNTDFSPGSGKWMLAFFSRGDQVVRLGPDAGLKTSHATAISADGSLVVGYSLGDDHYVNSAWDTKSGASVNLSGWGGEDSSKADRPEGQIDGLGDVVRKDPLSALVQAAITQLPGVARAVSAEGTVVVGDCIGFHTGIPEPFVTTRQSGRFLLTEYLQLHCPKAIKGWRLISVRGVSRDGRTLVGWGSDPKGKTEAWIATIEDPHKPYDVLLPPVKKSDPAEPDGGG
jgi:uncharacterized membrane protein